MFWLGVIDYKSKSDCWVLIKQELLSDICFIFNKIKLWEDS